MLKSFVLEKESGIPFHHQLYVHLKQNIDEGEYKPGDMFPSENEMQELFAVSRITIRRAVQDLVHDGYLEKQRGSGTRVVLRKNQFTLTELTSFSDDVLAQGKASGSLVLKCHKIPANVKVADNLKIGIGESVYYLKRLRLMDGKILGLHEAYIVDRADIHLDLECFTKNASLYEILQEQGIDLCSADETIEAKMPTNDLKRELYMEDNQPIFYKERVTCDTDRVPIEYVEISYIAERYKYYVHMNKGVHHEVL